MAKKVESMTIPTFYINIDFCALPAQSYPHPAPAKGVAKDLRMFFCEAKARRCYDACIKILQETE